MSLRNLKRNLWRTAGFWLAGLCGVALWPASQASVDAQGRGRAQGPATVQADAASLQLQQYWTAEAMAQAIPRDLGIVDVWQGSAPATGVQNLGNAPSGLAPGYDPTAPLAAFAKAVAAGPIQRMTSPPFSPPANPTDYGNYAPFQRWTHFGRYTTYPISTVGKLFFSLGGLNYVCSASVVNRNTIATAGHCVSGGAGNFATNFVFCPSYNPSGCVNGSFGWAFAATTNQWHFSGNIDRDFACIVTNKPGGVNIGDQTGWTGRAWNWATRQATFALGYPQASPFPGVHIITATSTEWYQIDQGGADSPTNHLSKYIGNDMTGGSSGGPWWLSYRHPNAAIEYPDTDGSSITDPVQGGGPFLNGFNSHKRCAGNCGAGLYSQEMGSPQLLNTADGNEFEDIFALCAANGGS